MGAISVRSGVLNAPYWTMFYRVYPKDVERQKERTALVAAGKF